MDIQLRDNEVTELGICLGRINNKERDVEDARLAYQYRMNLAMLERGIEPGTREIKKLDLGEKKLELGDVVVPRKAVPPSGIVTPSSTPPSPEKRTKLREKRKDEKKKKKRG